LLVTQVTSSDRPWCREMAWSLDRAEEFIGGEKHKGNINNVNNNVVKSRNKSSGVGPSSNVMVRIRLNSSRGRVIRYKTDRQD